MSISQSIYIYICKIIKTKDKSSKQPKFSKIGHEKNKFIIKLNCFYIVRSIWRYMCIYYIYICISPCAKVQHTKQPISKTSEWILWYWDDNS